MAEAVPGGLEVACGGADWAVADILEHLTVLDGILPRSALTAAVERWDEVRPALRARLQSYINGIDRSDRASNQTFYAIYLLAQQRDTTAFAALCAMALDAEAIEHVLGDGVTEHLSSLFVRLFDGDAAALRSVIEARDADEFARDAAFEALAWLTAAGRIDRAETERYLRDLFMTLEPQRESYAWCGWQQAIADLGLVELAGLARKAFSRGWIGRHIMSLRDFEDDLTKGCVAATPMGAFAERCRSLSNLDDIAGMMSTWACFTPQAPRRASKPATVLAPCATQPVRNPLRDVGRNDPCPCGSGKKFEKCCLGKAG